MTATGRICPACGAPTGDDPLDERGRCRSCYLEEHELVRVPTSLSIERCGGCGSIRRDGEWHDLDGAVVDLAIDRVAEAIEVIATAEDVAWEVRTEAPDERTIVVTAIVDVRIDGAWERRERTTEVAVEPTVCRRCSRIAGDDYGAIVQLRGTDRTPTDDEIARARELTASVLEDRVDVGDRDAFLTEAVERDEGLDLRLSTPRLGDQVSTVLRRDMGGHLETSSTLVTTDGDGTDVYRVTFTLRLAPYRPGDIVETDAGIELVERGSEGLDMLELTAGTRRSVDASALDAQVVATVDDATEAIIVARLDDRAVQVLHPETAEAVTVAHYEGVDLEGETVPAVVIAGEVYLLPSDG